MWQLLPQVLGCQEDVLQSIHKAEVGGRHVSQQQVASHPQSAFIHNCEEPERLREPRDGGITALLGDKCQGRTSNLLNRTNRAVLTLQLVFVQNIPNSYPREGQAGMSLLWGVEERRKVLSGASPSSVSIASNALRISSTFTSSRSPISSGIGKILPKLKQGILMNDNPAQIFLFSPDKVGLPGEVGRTQTILQDASV